MSRAELARRVQSDDSSISKYERNIKRPSAERLNVIASVLGLQMPSLAESGPDVAATRRRLFGTYIREHRERLGLSREALGRQIGTDGSSIAKYEKGAKRPSEERYPRIASAFGVSLDEIRRIASGARAAGRGPTTAGRTTPDAAPVARHPAVTRAPQAAGRAGGAVSSAGGARGSAGGRATNAPLAAVVGSTMAAAPGAVVPSSAAQSLLDRSPAAVRWFYDFINELVTAGATNQDIEMARGLLVGPHTAHFVEHDGSPKADEQVLASWRYLANLIRKQLATTRGLRFETATRPISGPVARWDAAAAGRVGKGGRAGRGGRSSTAGSGSTSGASAGSSR